MADTEDINYEYTDTINDIKYKTITKLKNNDKILDSALGEGFISVL